jgi:glutathione S-transferase
VVEAAVTASDYLCARRFTAADASVGYALLLAEQAAALAQGVDPTPSPALRPHDS